MGLIKLCCIVIGIFLAALIPALLKISIWWMLVAVIILAIRPVYTIFKK
jgi:hypothetical protein